MDPGGGTYVEGSAIDLFHLNLPLRAPTYIFSSSSYRYPIQSIYGYVLYLRYPPRYNGNENAGLERGRSLVT